MDPVTQGLLIAEFALKIFEAAGRFLQAQGGVSPEKLEEIEARQKAAEDEWAALAPKDGE